MGNLEAFMVKHDVVVKQDVEVDIAGSLVYDFLSAQSLFDILQIIQQFERLQGRLNLVYNFSHS